VPVLLKPARSNVIPIRQPQRQVYQFPESG
jgi:hypothetical protein